MENIKKNNVTVAENNETQNSNATSSAAPEEEKSTQQKNRRYNQQRKFNSKSQFNPRYKKRVCKFCKGVYTEIDYKNIEMLKKFISERGKILPRRLTGTCAKHQRLLAKEIKKARLLALLPFVAD